MSAGISIFMPLLRTALLHRLPGTVSSFHPVGGHMRLSRLACLAALAVSLPLHAEEYRPCEIDPAGPVLPAYLCAEKRAAGAAAQLNAELMETLAAFPSNVEPGSQAVTQTQLQMEQEKWSIYANAHCALVSRIPGAADWRVASIYENACLAHLFAERVAQLRSLRACVKEDGGKCLP